MALIRQKSTMVTIDNKMVAETNLSWTVTNFFSRSTKDGTSYESSTFAFAGAWWLFRINPNGNPKHYSEGFVGIYLFKIRGPPISVECTVGLKTSEDKIAKAQDFSETFNYNEGYGHHRFISRSELLNRQSELVPDGNLTLCWTLKGQKSTPDASGDAIEKCPYCAENVKAGVHSFHAERCPDKLIKCPSCCVEMALHNWDGHKCQIASFKVKETLRQAWKRTLLEGQNHNLILKVGNKELKTHKDILKARSKVFESLILNIEMKEENSCVLYVPDCNPKDMEQLLLYVYSGKVDALDENNMFGLYYVADKYDVQDLKKECCTYIKKSLTLTNICEVIQLASTHRDSSLLEKATEYFTNNVSDIIQTEEWQSFLKDNLTVGTALLVKSLDEVKNINI